jgi:hypothetical protein
MNLLFLRSSISYRLTTDDLKVFSFRVIGKAGHEDAAQGF